MEIMQFEKIIPRAAYFLTRFILDDYAGRTGCVAHKQNNSSTVRHISDRILPVQVVLALFESLWTDYFHHQMHWFLIDPVLSAN